MQIRTKLVIAVLVAMAVVTAIAATIIRVASERNVRLLAEEAVTSAEGAFTATERADVDKLTATLDAIAADPRYRVLFERRDRAGLAALALPLFRELRERHGVTHWYFHLPDRSCFLRVHKPEQFGDAVDRATLVAAAETGRVAAGKDLGKTAFALRAVRPWRVDGKLIGYLELGEELDGFLERMKRETGDDYALLVEKRHLDRALFAEVRKAAGRRDGWDDLPTEVVVDATATGPSMSAWAGDVVFLPAGGLFLGESAEEGRTFARGALPVADATGHRVGILVVRSDVGRMHANMTGAGRLVIGLLVVVAAVSCALLLFAIDVLVFRRLRKTTALLEDLSARLVGGDYDVAAGLPPAESDDEVGHFETFFGRFIAVVAETMRGLTARAGRG
jgi:HAMP domain-containing protein